jgi:hypothetical protein
LKKIITGIYLAAVVILLVSCNESFSGDTIIFYNFSESYIEKIDVLYENNQSAYIKEGLAPYNYAAFELSAGTYRFEVTITDGTVFKSRGTVRHYASGSCLEIIFSADHDFHSGDRYIIYLDKKDAEVLCKG